jgi:hypothetical protein
MLFETLIIKNVNQYNIRKLPIEANYMNDDSRKPATTTPWTKPVLTVLTRRSEEVVLGGCKEMMGGTGPGNAAGWCAQGDEFMCTNCSDPSGS